MSRNKLNVVGRRYVDIVETDHQNLRLTKIRSRTISSRFLANYIYNFSQNGGSDDHFEVLNGSISLLV